MAERQPEIQLIANLIVQRDDGKVLFVRYHEDDERWWLPGEDLEPYEHPDDRAHEVLASVGVTPVSFALSHIESFRGRRGWHVTFHYRVETDGASGGDYPVEWFPLDELPRTMHGRWEREAVQRALAVVA